MIRLSAFLFFVLFSFTASAQKYDSWEIYHNRKSAGSFNLKKETDDERRVVLLNRNLDGPGFFVIEFTPQKNQGDWVRNIAFFDSSGHSLRQFNNTLFLRILNSEISGILEGRQGVKVYSWAIPKDPAEAATVPERRILLCTIYTR